MSAATNFLKIKKKIFHNLTKLLNLHNLKLDKVFNFW